METRFILSLFQSAGAVLLGFLIALWLVIGFEAFGAYYHPFPPDVDPSDFAVCAAHVALYPQWILALATLSWSLTGFVATWIATRLGTGRHPAHGLGLGGFLLGMAVFNIVILPYPIWFKAITPVTLALAVYWGQKWAQVCKNKESCNMG